MFLLRCEEDINQNKWNQGALTVIFPLVIFAVIASKLGWPNFFKFQSTCIHLCNSLSWLEKNFTLHFSNGQVRF